MAASRVTSLTAHNRRYALELPQGYYSLFNWVGEDRFPIAALIRQEPVLLLQYYMLVNS